MFLCIFQPLSFDVLLGHTLHQVLNLILLSMSLAFVLHQNSKRCKTVFLHIQKALIYIGSKHLVKDILYQKSK